MTEKIAPVASREEPTKVEKGLGGWLNRNVLAFGLTSLLGDICHEMATAVLPQFMRAIGAGAASLGLIEGISDALASFVKLGAGFHSDKIGHRKAWTVAGYALTAVAKAIFGFALAWPLILVGRAIGWLGRGIRGPLRDAMLADSVDPHHRGKAFGFHRAGDTIGAVVGPLLAFWLLGLAADHPGVLKPFTSIFSVFTTAPGPEYRLIFLLTLIPGLLSVASVLFLVKEKRRPANHGLQFWRTLGAMPKAYRSFLVPVGIFGLADFAPTLMILRATNLLEGPMGLLEASRIAALLYLWRNVVYTVASFPIGVLSDRFSRSRFLAVGYGVAAFTFLGFALAPASIGWLTLFFGLAGVFIAWEDTLEGAAVRDYVDEATAGTAFGLLGVVNGIGDLVSSLMVGLLWTAFGAGWGFGYAVVVAFAGAVWMGGIRSARH
ncbi:MAG: MFS transporter [Desulfobacteraceae bacterium]|nr:MFS transporter [Desulfobacteraceae bacterium]